jgi:hypothetical protein
MDSGLCGGTGMMKLAWICYDDDDQYPEITVVFEEPDSRWSRVVPLVYAEIVKHVEEEE